MKPKPSSRLKSWLFRAGRHHARIGQTIALPGYAILHDRPTPWAVVAPEPAHILDAMLSMAANSEARLRELVDGDHITLLSDGTPAEVREFGSAPQSALTFARVLILAGPLAGAERWTLLNQTPARATAA